MFKALYRFLNSSETSYRAGKVQDDIQDVSRVDGGRGDACVRVDVCDGGRGDARVWDGGQGDARVRAGSIASKMAAGSIASKVAHVFGMAAGSMASKMAAEVTHVSGMAAKSDSGGVRFLFTVHKWTT